MILSEMDFGELRYRAMIVMGNTKKKKLNYLPEWVEKMSFTT